MKKALVVGAVWGLVVWPITPRAQTGAIRDIVILPRVVHNAAPDSKLGSFKVLPVVVIADTQLTWDKAGWGANRHDWAVSEDGEEPKAFSTTDAFELTFDLVLIGSPESPRKEAGIIITTAGAGDGQYIVNTDAGEVVSFGGPFPFYGFHLQPEDRRVTYKSGQKISMGVKYFRGGDGKWKIEFLADGKSSGPLDIPEGLGTGIPGPFFVKGYMQAQLRQNDPTNRSIAVFDNIRFNGKLIGY